jgi:antitoxin CptB
MNTAAIDIQRKRLVYQSIHRGTKELDLILSHFATRHLSTMTPEDLHQYELLLAEDEDNLYAWFTGTVDAPSHHVAMVDWITTCIPKH